jgi:hypothetical protein
VAEAYYYDAEEKGKKKKKKKKKKKREHEVQIPATECTWRSSRVGFGDHADSRSWSRRTCTSSQLAGTAAAAAAASAVRLAAAAAAAAKLDPEHTSLGISRVHRDSCCPRSFGTYPPGIRYE